MRRAIATISVAAFALVAAGCSALGGADVQEFTVGECVSDSSVSNEGSQEVGALPIVDCAEAHDGEVYYVENITDDSLPADVDARADALCFEQFEGYVGAPFSESVYYYAYLVPTSSSWDLGDREIVCLLVGEAGEQLTGSARGSAQ
jgi:guanyl-specific ribonuclease Sa